MGRNFRITPTTYATGVSADTGIPTLVTQGVEYPTVDVTEAMVMVSANGTGAADTIDVTPFWWDPTFEAWAEGAASTVTGTGVVAVYCVGTRLYLRFTNVTIGAGGDFNVSAQFLSKGV